jgi:hypothetical protein
MYLFLIHKMDNFFLGVIYMLFSRLKLHFFLQNLQKHFRPKSILNNLKHVWIFFLLVDIKIQKLLVQNVHNNYNNNTGGKCDWKISSDIRDIKKVMAISLLHNNDYLFPFYLIKNWHKKVSELLWNGQHGFHVLFFHFFLFFVFLKLVRKGIIFFSLKSWFWDL